MTETTVRRSGATASRLQAVLAVVNARYGSRRALLRHFRHRVGWRLQCRGVVLPTRKLRARRLVFVCQGNICRSALAEAVAHAHGIDACSFGLDTVDGKAADPRMRQLADELGYDLAGHRATPIDRYEARADDLVLLMEPEHHGLLISLAPSLHAPVGLLGLWARPKRPYIHDPFAADDGYMRHCARVIEGAVLNLNRCLKQADV